MKDPACSVPVNAFTDIFIINLLFIFVKNKLLIFVNNMGNRIGSDIKMQGMGFPTCGKKYP